MPFTAQELDHAAAAAIEYHYDTPKVRSQTIQDKPLLRKMTEKTKKFPGGKDNITVRVKGVYSTTISGFEADDTVSYVNPANLKTATYPWKLIHSGIQFTMHELLKSGISIVDSKTGEKTSNASRQEKIMLANLLNDKVEDMVEGTDRGMNVMFWRDGTQDASLVPGITSFIVDDPTAVATVGGIDQSVDTWWQNRADLAIALGSGPETGAVLNKLQVEFRQLRRYGGKPDLILAGSDMMDRIEKELKAQGYYTDSGWAKSGRIDGSVTDLAFKNVMIEYDPTMDDLGFTKRAYVLDCKSFHPMCIDGEDGKDHAPARPEDQYVFYRARTWVGGLVCKQRNANGVYGFA
ncbi:MAG: phage major capsid protein [Pseudomonadota bacterium]